MPVRWSVRAQRVVEKFCDVSGASFPAGSVPVTLKRGTQAFSKMRQLLVRVGYPLVWGDLYFRCGVSGTVVVRRVAVLVKGGA